MQLGIIGLGTMGANLARNAARNGTKVFVYNRTTEKTDTFMKKYGNEGDFIKCDTLKDLVSGMEGIRSVLIMVKAGDATDAVIKDLIPLLSEDDIIIDGGNSLFTDTERRVAELKKKKINFLGLGVSGGEEGALNGPSMMPGGSKEAYTFLEPILQAMAADDGENGNCVSYVGEGGAGHFVKMVHNGIEYGVMQLIAEVYAVLKNIGELSNSELAEVFGAWSKDNEMSSFLLEITAKIFKEKDEDGEDLIDKIKDKAGQKGTGKWTTQSALNLGVAIPTINAAVDARIFSGNEDRRSANTKFELTTNDCCDLPSKDKLISIAKNAYKLSLIYTYTQGFDLLNKASTENNWNLDLSEVARLWRGGCIIRNAILPTFQKLYLDDEVISKKMLDDTVKIFSDEPQRDWRRFTAIALNRGVPVPAFSSTVTSFDALRTERLPQNLIQAQRDFFGSHGYERLDRNGQFHTKWTE